MMREPLQPSNRRWLRLARLAYYAVYTLGGIALLQGSSVIPAYGAMLLWPLVVVHAAGGTRPSLPFFVALVGYSLIAWRLIGAELPFLFGWGEVGASLEFGLLVLCPAGLAWWLARLERKSLFADYSAADTPPRAGR